jgi:predicted DNA-binding transcriptional regulator YafY
MNRIDRLYAVVEELRAAGPRGRAARQLAAHFEVSVRTIERDLSALGQAGVPLATKQGRTGGYTLDRSMSLPQLNFTPREATAVAVALSGSENSVFARDARTALQKIVTAMPAGAVAEARSTAGKVRLLVRPALPPGPDATVTETIWRAVRDNDTLHIRYTDVGGLETERDVEPQLIVVGPRGTSLTAWCHLRGEDRAFRLDRITGAKRIPSPRRRGPHRSRPSPATKPGCRPPRWVSTRNPAHIRGHGRRRRGGGGHPLPAREGRRVCR